MRISTTSLYLVLVTLLAELITSNLRCLKVKLVQTTYVDAPIGREERNLLSDSSYSRMPEI